MVLKPEYFEQTRFIQSCWCPGSLHLSIHQQPRYCMVTSSNGNIFRVTGHLCGEFTGPRWIPCTKASDAELWCFHEAGDLRRYRAHYDATVLSMQNKQVIVSHEEGFQQTGRFIFEKIIWNANVQIYVFLIKLSYCRELRQYELNKFCRKKVNRRINELRLISLSLPLGPVKVPDMLYDHPLCPDWASDHPGLPDPIKYWWQPG